MPRIAGVQPLEHLNNVSGALALIINQTKIAERRGASLVCFPECYLQGYIVDTEQTAHMAISLASEAFRRILLQLAALKPTIVVGLIESCNSTIYNSAAVIREGKLLGVYRKVNLLPGESTVFTAGSDFPLFDLDGTKFGINICYDLNFEKSARCIAEQGAQLLVNPCNNMHKQKLSEEIRDRHNQLRTLRCRETNMWILSSDVTGKREAEGRVSFGPTAVVDPTGVVVAQADLNQEGMVVYDLPGKMI